MVVTKAITKVTKKREEGRRRRKTKRVMGTGPRL